MLQHSLGIVLHPDQEWHAIRDDRHSFMQVFFSHVPLLALIPVLSAFYGVTQVGWSFGGGSVIKLTTESAMVLCSITYIAILFGVFILGEFINWMSLNYGVKDSQEARHFEGTALAVYAATPLLLVGVFQVYPHLWLNASVTVMAMAYSVYLIYEGIPILMNISEERAFLFATSVITVALVMVVSVRVGSVVLWTLGAGPVYID